MPSKSPALSSVELAAPFADSDLAEKFPPVLTIEQAATLLQVPVQTIYGWRSRGLLNTCSFRVGRHVRFWRARLLDQVLNRGLQP